MTSAAKAAEKFMQRCGTAKAMPFPFAHPESASLRQGIGRDVPLRGYSLRIPVLATTEKYFTPPRCEPLIRSRRRVLCESSAVRSRRQLFCAGN